MNTESTNSAENQTQSSAENQESKPKSYPISNQDAKSTEMLPSRRHPTIYALRSTSSEPLSSPSLEEYRDRKITRRRTNW